MGTRSRRECLFLVSLFFLVSKLGHAQRIKFKSLWTFSFCTLFVFLELLWFTSLVSFTGFYMEDKPKFFCDCPTDVSLRSPFPTCFLFLSSFFFLCWAFTHVYYASFWWFFGGNSFQKILIAVTWKNYRHEVDQDFHQNFLRFSLPSLLRVSFKNGTLMTSEVVQGTWFQTDGVRNCVVYSCK